MQVRDLKKLIAEADDDMPVMVLIDDTFYPPIMELSGVSEMGPVCDENGNETEEQPEQPDVFFSLIMEPQNEV